MAVEVIKGDGAIGRLGTALPSGRRLVLDFAEHELNLD